MLQTTIEYGQERGKPFVRDGRAEKANIEIN